MYLLGTKLSCKVAEIAATRTLKAQFFFVCHAKRSIKKSHLLRSLHSIHAIHDYFTDVHHSGTLLINIHAGQEVCDKRRLQTCILAGKQGKRCSEML